MVSYIARRLLLMIPTLFGITVMVFLIARLAPGRPGQMQIGSGGMSAEEARSNGHNIGFFFAMPEPQSIGSYQSTIACRTSLQEGGRRLNQCCECSASRASVAV